MASKTMSKIPHTHSASERQQQFVNSVLEQSLNKTPLTPKKGIGKGQAPVNIALSKYWGKRDKDLNLPTNSSVSISLPGLGTQTEIRCTTQGKDQVILNGQALDDSHPFATRVSRFLNHFRTDTNTYFKVDTINTVPTAAGLASSASGYAALVLALNDLFEWNLSLKQLSLLARFGSGSASRSLYPGFAVWNQGSQEDGMDSLAEPMDTVWPEFCIGLLEIDVKEKPVSSTQGMQQTVETCDLYQAWPQQANRDVDVIKQAIINKDLPALGKKAEHNALSMHATMIATWPPIVYWQPDSVASMHKIWQLREQGLQLYFTMDAGPNLKLMFLEKDRLKVERAFNNVKVIMPFK